MIDNVIGGVTRAEVNVARNRFFSFRVNCVELKGGRGGRSGEGYDAAQLVRRDERWAPVENMLVKEHRKIGSVGRVCQNCLSLPRHVRRDRGVRENIAERPGMVLVMVGQQKILYICEMGEELWEDRRGRRVYQEVIEHIATRGKVERSRGANGAIESVLTTATEFQEGRDPGDGSRSSGDGGTEAVHEGESQSMYGIRMIRCVFKTLVISQEPCPHRLSHGKITSSPAGATSPGPTLTRLSSPVSPAYQSAPPPQIQPFQHSHSH